MYKFNLGYVSVLSIFILCGSLKSEVNFTPVINLMLLGGQFNFDNEVGSYGGYLDLDFVPVIEIDEDVMLVFGYIDKYRSVKDIIELTGGAAIYQELRSQSLFCKFNHKSESKFEINPGFTYKKELYKSDENTEWGNGLFDNEKQDVNFELIKRYEKFLVIGGYNYSLTKFINYNTLSDLYEQLGSTELAKSGVKLFDFNSNNVYITNEINLDYFLFRSNLILTEKNYEYQKVINELGEYDPINRKDNIGYIIIDLNAYVGRNIVPGLKFEFIKYNSNQNHYDSLFNKFIPEYYNYTDTNISPYINIPIGYTVFSLTYGFGNKKYDTRLVQDENGNYDTNNKIIVTTELMSLSVSYMVTKNFSFIALSELKRVYSNTKYEQLYQYNYNSLHYFFGISFKT